MSRNTRNRLIGFAIAAVVFAADQYVKWLVRVPLNMRPGDTINLLPIFALTRTHNFGVSLGMFYAHSQDMRWALVGITTVIALGVAVWILVEKRFGDLFAQALVLGGALSNIRDRVRFGYVLDYADLHFGSFRPFLVFNIGDACITIGVLIILARSLFMREKPPETQSPTHSEPPALLDDAVETAIEPQADHSAETQ